MLMLVLRRERQYYVEGAPLASTMCYCFPLHSLGNCPVFVFVYVFVFFTFINFKMTEFMKEPHREANMLVRWKRKPGGKHLKSQNDLPSKIPYILLQESLFLTSLGY